MTTERFLRLPTVEAMTGLSKRTIYRLIEAGDFPENIKLTARAVAWRESEVVAWQRQRLQQAVAA